MVATIWQIFRNRIAQCCVFLGMWYFQVGNMKNVSPIEFPSHWSHWCCFCSPTTERVKVQFYPSLSLCPLLQSGSHLQLGRIALEQALRYHQRRVQSSHGLYGKTGFYQKPVCVTVEISSKGITSVGVFWSERVSVLEGSYYPYFLHHARQT